MREVTGPYIVSVRYLQEDGYTYKEPYAVMYSNGELFHHSFADFFMVDHPVDINMKKFLKYCREHANRRVHMHGAKKDTGFGDSESLSSLPTCPDGLFIDHKTGTGVFCAYNAIANLIDISGIKQECLKRGGLSNLGDLMGLLSHYKHRRKQYQPRLVYNNRKHNELPNLTVGKFVLCSTTHHCYSVNQGWVLDTDPLYKHAVPWAQKHLIQLFDIELAYELVRIKVFLF